MDDIRMQWRKRLKARRDGHLENVAKFGRRNKQLGIPTIVVATIVSSAVFATMGKSDLVWMQVIAGFLSLVAAALSATQTFLGYESLVEKNQAAQAGYAELMLELEGRELLGKLDDDAFVESFQKKWSELNTSSPSLPTSARQALTSLGEPVS